MGDAKVWGNLTARGASALVDDPAQPGEPEAMMLHPFVESPERRSIHDGVVTANASGEATVQLPVWFEGMNKEVRYQLTAIGKAAPTLHVKSEVKGNVFQIGGANAGQRVSWQLTGLRRG